MIPQSVKNKVDISYLKTSWVFHTAEGQSKLNAELWKDQVVMSRTATESADSAIL